MAFPVVKMDDGDGERQLQFYTAARKFENLTFSFCDCWPNADEHFIRCSCGEDSKDIDYEWSWDEASSSDSTVLYKENREVRFHPGYSSGTAAVRGDSTFKFGHVYYWEIKILTTLYGTDVMIGVGTPKVELNNSRFSFCSLLGADKESWGFSYKGKSQHNGVTEKYGSPFDKGSIIGIYLNMWTGRLEFFLNRMPLGVAYKVLQDQELYPMVCSTAAKSAVRIILTRSRPISLKLLSLENIGPSEELLREYLKTMPGLRNYVQNLWWIIKDTDEQSTSTSKQNNKHYQKWCGKRCFPSDGQEKNVRKIRNKCFVGTANLPGSSSDQADSCICRLRRYNPNRPHGPCWFCHEYL